MNGAIGYGLLFLCGFAPQAWIFSKVLKSDEIVYVYSCVFVFNATASMVAFFFILPHCATNFEFERTDEDGAGPGIVLALMFHLSLAGLMVCLPHLIGFLLGGYETRLFLHAMLITWYYPLMFWPCSMEFVVYLMAFIYEEGGMRVGAVKNIVMLPKAAKQLPEATKYEIFETRVCEPNCLCGIEPQLSLTRSRELPPIAIEYEEQSMIPQSAGLECDLCCLEYSDQLIPRILVGCGHTMCHGCIEKLLESGGYNIICPFCRITTRVPAGWASQLPKNYSLLAIVQDRNN
ncbi:hypothetical protein CAEBREN_01164 [Caenorhabditis brenneri]|uniref:RING-type domain-containing protein n=1 Tax=Caenorhabditis brenneri TaxID=135651 RepID=G0N7Y3_CAEBE|nr:hypothetical protein CAEBREN_01164 [Caenorhabditis brenneri]